MYDVIIIGAGPAGLSAGIYAARANLKTLIIEEAMVGGQISLTLAVDNYPGLNDNPTGPEIGEKMLNQAIEFGAEKVTDKITEVDLFSEIKLVKSEKSTYEAKAVIIATGADAKKLDIPGEKELTGKGVAYCATCDGPFYNGAEVYVVGGGDAAVEEAIFLTKFARKVFILYRGDKLKAAKSIQDKAFENEKIEVLYNTEVKEIHGQMAVDKLVTYNNLTKEYSEIHPNDGDKDFGLFIFIGYVPNTEIFEGQVKLDRGYILADAKMQTNLDGVYAAGDVVKKDIRQVITAASDGAVAAVNAEKYIESLVWYYSFRVFIYWQVIIFIWTII